MTKEISVLSYTTINIGDEIQSLAAINVLNKLGIKHGGFVDRDNPKASGKTHLLVNGFILDNALDIKSQDINLIFSNLHIDSQNEKGLNKRIEMLRQYQPIGCRDRYSMDLLHKAGIEAFYNRCLTLTFDRRKKEPLNGKVILVDIDPNTPLPRSIKKNIYHIEHNYLDDLTTSAKMIKAQKLLDTYREAKLVITSRLHCALPCIAMGVPVILLGDHDPHRLSIAWDFIPCSAAPTFYRYQKSRYIIKQILLNIRYLLRNKIKQLIFYATDYRKIDWDPQPLDIEPLKQEIIAKVDEQIKRFT